MKVGQMHNDTERLDWVMSHAPDFDMDNKDKWMRFYQDSYWHVISSTAEHYVDAWRECIDKAINGDFQ